MTHDTIHEVVRNRYGAIARVTDTAAQTSTCCGPSTQSASCCSGTTDSAAACGCSSNLHDATMLEGLPVNVTSLSLGCGDPITIASLQPGEIVLDLGSGGGIDCFIAAKRVGYLGKVIGVDMTPEMIAKASTAKTKMGVRNVEFRLGQIEALPVDDHSVDVVMSNCVINLSPDKPMVFREAFRVLRSGGRVAISDIVTEGSFTPELRAKADKWAECVTGAIDSEVYANVMRDVGFVDVLIVDKVEADEIVERQAGMPRLFSARITARKP